MDNSENVESCEVSISENCMNGATEGLEDVSINDANSCDIDGEEEADDSELSDSVEEEIEGNSGGDGGCTFGPETAIDGADDIAKVNFMQLKVEDLMRFHFPNISIAFMFYNWYASIKGFAGRKDRVMKNKSG
ncbi:hypothetical protein TSUD_279330 [Trifolium subterraneum]|uniref:Uncharacterized protein n=1 Tax=Trifolium subterraneum TaxID=3900 RepID=A0A2Z6NQ36_TRISU|nr:hypothetical protein TSUD_279330 [Trifolium subterraneum]